MISQSAVVHNDDEVNARNGKTSTAFGRLCGSICDLSGIRPDTHKAESIQIGGAANTIIRMRNLDSLPTACQKTESFPYKLS